jgi:hypothetical protein
MTNYLATPFHGDRHDEDPSDFLNWFLQYMGTADNKMKARNFIYYLQADSLADEWLEELGVEEKGSWEVIEVLFRKKWLKEEEISIKKSAIVENKPHIPSTISHLVEIAPEVTPTAQNQHDKSPTTPQSLTPFENGKKTRKFTLQAKIHRIWTFFLRRHPPSPSQTQQHLPAPSQRSKRGQKWLILLKNTKMSKNRPFTPKQCTKPLLPVLLNPQTMQRESMRVH